MKNLRFVGMCAFIVCNDCNSSQELPNVLSKDDPSSGLPTVQVIAITGDEKKVQSRPTTAHRKRKIIPPPDTGEVVYIKRGSLTLVLPREAQSQIVPERLRGPRRQVAHQFPIVPSKRWQFGGPVPDHKLAGESRPPNPKKTAFDDSSIPECWFDWSSFMDDSVQQDPLSSSGDGTWVIADLSDTTDAE
jgi:hypothetical protein